MDRGRARACRGADPPRADHAELAAHPRRLAGRWPRCRIAVPFRELIAARVYRFDGTTQAVETAGFIVEPASAPAVLSYINGAPPASSPAASSMSRWVTATRLQICRRICALCSESGARFTHWNCRCWSVPAFALTLLHALWTGHDAGINGFVNLSALLMSVFRRSFRRLRHLCHRPRARKAGQRYRGGAANPGRRIAEGGRQEQEEVMSRSFDIHPLISKTAAMTRIRAGCSFGSIADPVLRRRLGGARGRRLPQQG